ncbi:hypothetical protein FACS189459_4560 [Bacilli bacterium]|nr:hypothetical protein FACS189459_4560 [Bacilli bacterium]
MYINGAIQNGLYSGSTLEPVCETGFFSKKLIDKNKNGTTPKATITMVVLVLMFASLILLIPDIIQGSQLLSQISQLSTREEKI